MTKSSCVHAIPATREPTYNHKDSQNLNTKVQISEVSPHLLDSVPLQSPNFIKLGLGFGSRYCA